MNKFVLFIGLALAAVCIAAPPPVHEDVGENESDHHLERRHLVGGLNDYGGAGGFGGHHGGHGGLGGIGGVGVPISQSFSKSSASASSVSGGGSVLG